MMSELETQPTPKRGSFFSPSLFDLVAILAIVTWINAILAANAIGAGDGLELRRVLAVPVWIAMVLSCFAVGAGLAHCKWSWKFVWPLLLVHSIAAGIFIVLQQWFEPPLSVYQQYSELDRGWIGNQSLVNLCLLAILILLVSVFAGWFACWLFRNSWRLVRYAWSGLKMTRTKALVSFAVVLFLIHLGSKAAGIGIGNGNGNGNGNDSSYDSLGGGVLLSLFFSVVTPLLAFAAGVYFPSRYSAKFKTWFTTKFFLILIASIIVGGVTAYAFLQKRHLAASELMITIAWVLGPLIFLSTLLLVTQIGSSRIEPDDSSRVDALLSSGHWKPSVWSLLITTPLVLAGCFFYYQYDLTVLLGFKDYRNRASFASVLEHAKVTREIYRSTNGAIQRGPNGECIATIRDEQDADCLLSLPPTALYLLIKDVQPFVKLGTYKSLVILEGGTLDKQQVKTLFTSCPALSIADTETPDDVDKTIAPPRQIMLRFTKPGQLKSFLDKYIFIKDGGYLNIQGGIKSVEDWEAVVRASKFRNASIFESELTPEILANDYTDQLSNIEIQFDVSIMKNGVDPQVEKFIVRGRMNSNHLDFIDSIPPGAEFLFGNTYYKRNQQLHHVRDPAAYPKTLTDIKWAYEWNDQQEITAAWIPDPELVYPSSLQKLKKLRMDSLGFVDLTKVGQGFDGSKLEGLTSLEELILREDLQMENLEFLGGLPNLKLLQICEQDRIFQSGAGFEQCVNLERLVLFGSPDKKLIKELALLKKLRSILIINIHLEKPDYPEKLSAAFAGVEVKMIEPEDYKVELSSELERHIQKVRDDFLEK